MGKSIKKVPEKPVYDAVRAATVKIIAQQFKVSNEYVRSILNNGTSSLKSIQILKGYNKKYAELEKAMNN